MDVALVELVEHDDPDAAKLGVGDELAHQDSFGDKANAGIGPGDILEANLVADLPAHGLLQLVGDPNGGEACGDAPRLQDDDLPVAGREHGEQGRGDAGGLARAGRSFDDDASVLLEGSDDGGQAGIDGQGFQRAGC